MLRTLYEQLAGRRGPSEVTLVHEEYQGRNVLSIAHRDPDDVAEAPKYYEQLVFTRWRKGSPSEQTEQHGA
jgi:hypothetical protein